MDNFLELAEESGIEAMDFIVDKITESKYFDGFPIISQMLAVLKAVKLLPNYLYAKKTCAFLDGIMSENMDCDTFSKAMKELNKNTKKFEVELLFLIEKAENAEKANLVGFVTRLFALRVIDYNTFLLFSSVINNIQMVFLKKYSELYLDFATLKNSNIYNVLSSQGLIANKNAQMSIGDVPLLFETELSEEGKLLGKFLKQYFDEKS